MGAGWYPVEVKVDEQTQEYLDTMIAQFRALAPTVIRHAGQAWVRRAYTATDVTDLSFPAVGFTYAAPTGTMTVRVTLNVGADDYDLRVMAGGRVIVDLSGVYMDQLEDIQVMIDRAAMPVPAMA